MNDFESHPSLSWSSSMIVSRRAGSFGTDARGDNPKN
jgi:hypothetical protein